MATLSENDKLVEQLKKSMNYSETRMACEACQHSKYGGNEGFTLFCILNPAVNFKVAETSWCMFFTEKTKT